ncbi:MAG: tetratricopeptide repeat protein [Selenomonadaceae bacterium]|nr:tetratricopeptide repeat protein [Selenomonadaceae bacterium]
MTQETFHKLVHKVMETPAHPPETLFAGGMDDWHARARLAHFLAMPNMNRTAEAIELFRSVGEEEIDDENAEDVEEKVYALQKLSSIEKEMEGKKKDALRHIGEAIELAESTDFLYKYILRGELWGDRWNLMHHMDMTQEAESEADERIEAYKDIPIQHNSYLYYGYRFKAMLAAERGVPLVAKDYMHMALHSMEIPKDYEAGLEKAFSATHDNAAWILNEVDRATPNPDHLHWDI